MLASSSVTRMVAISAPRQLEGEAGPARRGALQIYPAAVRLHDVAHDGEAEPGGSRLADAVMLGEALEDPFLLLGRDAGPRVVDGDPHDVAVGRGRDFDAAATRSVAERICDQIRKCPR